MYWITVDVNYVDVTKAYRRFDTWDDAGCWLSGLAGGKKVPRQVLMNIVWS